MAFLRQIQNSRGQERLAGPNQAESGVPAQVLPLLSTEEAARYLHRSVSWMLRRKDIPYLPGRPNLYSVEDLHAWFERKKYMPKV